MIKSLDIEATFPCHNTECGFDSMMRLSGMGRWMLDVSQNKISCDKHLITMFEYPDNRLLLLDFDNCCAGIFKADVERLALAWKNFKHNDALVFAEEFRYAKASGEFIWISCRAEKVWSEDASHKLFICGSVQNIHLRKSKELELEQYQQRLTHTKEIAHIGSWETDIFNGDVTLSDIALRTIGLDTSCFPSAKELLGLILIEHHKRALLKAVCRLRAKGGSFDQEIAIQHQDGQLRWLRVVGTAGIEESGQRRIYGLIQDVHEQVSVRNKLAAQEELFRNTFEYSGNGIALVSTTGQWLKVNPAFCSFLGYTETELRKKTFQDITFPADLNADLTLVNKVLTGEINGYQLEKRYFHKSGRIVWALLTVSITRDDRGQPLHFISQIADITRPKYLSSELEKTNAWLKSFFNSSRSNHFILDNKFRVIFFNQAADENSQLLSSQRMKAGADIRKIINPAFLKTFSSCYQSAIKGQKQEIQTVLSYPHVNRIHHWNLQFDPIVGQEGEIIGVSYIATDITSTVETEAKIIRQDVSLKTIAFLQSHEMRRPVASILGLINVFRINDFHVDATDFEMLEHAFKEFDEKIRQVIGHVDESL